MARHNAKITEKDVREIRRLLAEGVPNSVLANKYGLGKQTICDIKMRRSWKEVK